MDNTEQDEVVGDGGKLAGGAGLIDEAPKKEMEVEGASAPMAGNAGDHAQISGGPEGGQGDSMDIETANGGGDVNMPASSSVIASSTNVTGGQQKSQQTPQKVSVDAANLAPPAISAREDATAKGGSGSACAPALASTSTGNAAQTGASPKAGGSIAEPVARTGAASTPATHTTHGGSAVSRTGSAEKMPQAETPAIGGGQTGGSGGGAYSRSGRKRTVTNFARLLDPISRSNSSPDPPPVVKSPPVAPPPPSEAVAEPVSNNLAMVDAVRAMVYKVGEPSAQVASAAVNPNSDKYIGVRIKQSGFGAVIKKNHSEINLGIYDTAEEAARAYDMAALVCQGDRAKVNFSDSLALYQANYSPDLKIAIPVNPRVASPARDRSYYDKCFSDPNCHPRLVGSVLTDLADRLPYSAVRSTDYSLWKQYATRNASLEAWADFGAQLAWLLREQLDHVVLSQGWDYAGWEARCGGCSSSAEAGRLLREVEGEGGKGIDWKKVGEMWDREGPDVAGSVGSKRQSGMGGHSHHKGGSATGGSSFAIADAPAVAPQKVVKKRDYVLDDGTLVSAELVDEFVRINSFMADRDACDSDVLGDGIGPTLDQTRVAKRNRPTPVFCALPASAAPAAAVPTSPHVHPQSHHAGASGGGAGGSKNRAGRPSGTGSAAAATTTTTSAAAAAAADALKNAKGLACRFCGKVFTHAPAHLQHERAHMQQQDSLSPASRLYPLPGGSPSATPHSGRLRDPALPPDMRLATGSRYFEDLPARPAIKLKQVTTFLLELAQRIPTACVTLHDAGAWESWGVTTAQVTTLQQAADQLLVLASHLDASVMCSTWDEDKAASWRSDCDLCESAAELMSLGVRLDTYGIHWSSMEAKGAQGGCSGSAGAGTGGKLIKVKHVLQLAADSAKDKKRGGRAGTADWPESVQLRCVENSVPCISCSAQNKGIAACFALGHLYVSNSGSLPSSCKDCKQRNKGALFCFKRGHMRKLVTVPNTGIGFEGHVLDRGETSGEENGDAEMVLR